MKLKLTTVILTRVSMGLVLVLLALTTVTVTETFQEWNVINVRLPVTTSVL